VEEEVERACLLEGGGGSPTTAAAHAAAATKAKATQEQSVGLGLERRILGVEMIK